MIKKMHKSGVIAAGLALFSMFFGAGDLIWPLILGGNSGNQNLFNTLGFLITGVSLPLLGLVAMLLFQGNYRAFFNQTGKVTGWILLFMIQAILGPLGSLPRLFTLAFATLHPYLPTVINLPIFSVFACVIVLLFTIKRHQIVDIIGVVLAPLLLLSLAMILILGFLHHPVAPHVEMTHSQGLFTGMRTGYYTLDMIASFIFAPVVISYFRHDEKGVDANLAKKHVIIKMLKSCALCGVLLASVFVGLTYLASYYTQHVGPHDPAERLSLISMHILGPKGAFFSCIVIALSCLTTAIPISIISAEYIHKEFMKEQKHFFIPAAMVSLGISLIVANFGFMGIAQMLDPVLQILCPGLIILCVMNILHKLYEVKTRKVPIFIAFGISLLAFLIRL